MTKGWIFSSLARSATTWSHWIGNSYFPCSFALSKFVFVRWASNRCILGCGFIGRSHRGQLLFPFSRQSKVAQLVLTCTLLVQTILSSFKVWRQFACTANNVFIGIYVCGSLTWNRYGELLLWSNLGLLMEVLHSRATKIAQDGGVPRVKGHHVLFSVRYIGYLYLSIITRLSFR